MSIINYQPQHKPQVSTYWAPPYNIETLAKLLSEEDVMVVHRINAPTAYFDPKTRTITLPCWNDLSKQLYHMLVEHEVGHAIYTPMEDWVKTVTEDRSISMTLNVVEDARIERLIKYRYPGARKDFIQGYKELYARGFFGFNNNKTNPAPKFETYEEFAKAVQESPDSMIGYKDLAEFGIVDRINLYYKIGDQVVIPFKEEEQYFLDQIDNMKTFDDTIRIAKELHEYQKTGQMPNKQGDEQNDQAADGSADEESGRHKSADGMVYPQDGAAYKIDENASVDGRDMAESEEGEGEEITIETMDAFDRKMNSLNRTKIANRGADKIVDLRSDLDPDYWIIPYTRVLEEIKRAKLAMDFTFFERVKKRNLASINYLVKEFLMKKAADGFKRMRQDKTGSIDMDKLHSYQLVEDIFKRNAIIPEAKNHGMCMFIDFSGSMSGCMMKTLEQLITLVLFCRKVNIPYRVYAFSDCTGDSVPAEQSAAKYISTLQAPIHAENSLIPRSSFSLVELFNEQMSATQFRNAAAGLLNNFGMTYEYRRNNAIGNSRFFGLGGTPLNPAIALAPSVLHKFQAETKSQIVSAIFLTDGDNTDYSAMHSSNGVYSTTGGSYGLGYSFTSLFRHGKKYLNGTDFKDVTTMSRANSTKTLLKWVGSFGYPVVGFFLAPSNSIHYALKQEPDEIDDNDEDKYDDQVERPIVQLDENNIDVGEENRKKIIKNWRDNGCASIRNINGYDTYIVISTNRMNDYNDNGTSAANEAAKNFSNISAKKSDISRAAKVFGEERVSRQNNKMILNGFIDAVVKRKNMY